MDENDFVETGNWQLCAKWGQRALPDERAEAVRQLLEKEQTVEQIVSRFNLSSVQVVYGWIGRYIEESLLSDTSQKPEVDSKELTLSEALTEIKRLKKALDLEKMRSAGYSHMIELAEQQFNILIRKKIWHQTVGWLRSIWPRISLDKCCALFGYCRQAYYKHSTVKDFDTEAANELIVQSVRQHREMMPRIGSRKLYVLAQHELGKPCWRTSGQTPREVDFIEIVDGKMRAFECKLSPKTKSKAGKVFFNAYPDCPVETLTPRDLMRLWQEDETIEYK